MKNSNNGPYAYQAPPGKSPNNLLGSSKVPDTLSGVSVPQHNLEALLSGKVIPKQLTKIEGRAGQLRTQRI